MNIHRSVIVTFCLFALFLLTYFWLFLNLAALMCH